MAIVTSTEHSSPGLCLKRTAARHRRVDGRRAVSHTGSSVHLEGTVGFSRREIRAGEQCGLWCVSVSLRKVRGMSERRFRRTLGGVSSLGLHLVWCLKYRRPILRARCGELLDQIAREHGWQIVAKEHVPDHVHLFVRVGPTAAAARVVRAFTGRTARILRQELPHLRNLAKVLWSPSYFGASVGYVSEPTVRRYIEDQWDAVMVS